MTLALRYPHATSVLELLLEARSALALATNVVDVKDWRDKAEALRGYMRQQGECLEVQNAAAEIKIRAERRAGELLAEMPSAAGRPRKNLSHDVTDFREPSLDEIGIERMQSHRWQRAASVPEAIFEQHVEATKAAGKELTSASVLRLATPPPVSDPEPLGVDEAVVDLVMRLHAIWKRWPESHMRTFGNKLIDLGHEVLRTGEIAS